MARKFNRGPLGDAITRFFDIQGGANPEYDETLSAQLKLADLDDSPYLRFAIPVARHGLAAAVALEFSVLVARPASSVVLQLTQIQVSNEGAAAQLLTTSLLSEANVTSAGIALQSNMRDLTSMSLTRPSAIWQGSHGSIVGANIARLIVPPSQTVIYQFPKPGILLFGNDPDGVGGFGVWGRTANEAVDVGFYGREWPLA